MPLPSRSNPMGLNGEMHVFELTVQPGILGESMTYGFTPYWNPGGYCRVLDWGDGTGEKALASGSVFSHTYSLAGTYRIRIKADCYRVTFGDNDVYAELVKDCNQDWDSLGMITNGQAMFSNCSNAVFRLRTLPENLSVGNYMFYKCSQAEFQLSILPDALKTAVNMFGLCSLANFEFDSLPEGLYDADYMFNSCPAASLPIRKLPDGLLKGARMFTSCTNALLPLSELPDGLKDCNAMFFQCSSAELNISSLPESLTNGLQMFRGCSKAVFHLQSLPSGLLNAQSMFRECPEAEINVSTLAENAPEGGYQMTDIGTMFYNSQKVIGSKSAFLAACPYASDNYTFNGTSTTM